MSLHMQMHSSHAAKSSGKGKAKKSSGKGKAKKSGGKGKAKKQMDDCNSCCNNHGPRGSRGAHGSRGSRGAHGSRGPYGANRPFGAQGPRGARHGGGGMMQLARLLRNLVSSLSGGGGFHNGANHQMNSFGGSRFF